MVRTWYEEYKKGYVVIMALHIEVFYHSLDSRVACDLCSVYCSRC